MERKGPPAAASRRIELRLKTTIMSASRQALPLRITLVLWVVLIITAWNLVRAWGGLVLWGGIREYAPWPGPVYVIVTGGLWALFGLLTLLAFWRRASWADKLLLGCAVTYVAWLWLDRLEMQPSLSISWPFSLVTNLVLLLYAAVVALDPRNRRYLGKEAHGRQEQDRKTE